MHTNLSLLFIRLLELLPESQLPPLNIRHSRPPPPPTQKRSHELRALPTYVPPPPPRKDPSRLYKRAAIPVDVPPSKKRKIKEVPISNTNNKPFVHVSFYHM